MSMTSKVNSGLRSQIIALLAGGVKRTNSNIAVYVPNSVRAVQEATQKMTKEGVLVSSREAGKTYYTKSVRSYNRSRHGFGWRAEVAPEAASA